MHCSPLRAKGSGGHSFTSMTPPFPMPNVASFSSRSELLTDIQRTRVFHEAAPCNKKRLYWSRSRGVCGVGGSSRGTSDLCELLSCGHQNALHGEDAGLFELLDVESADAARPQNVDVFVRSRIALLLVALFVGLLRHTAHRRCRCAALLTTLRTDMRSQWESSSNIYLTTLYHTV